MNYATVAQLRSALNPAGGPDSGTAATLPDLELEQTLARADAEINGYLSGLYTLPLQAPFPALVVQLAVDLAVLDGTLRYRRSVPLVKDDPIRLRGEEARRLLQRIGDGRVDLIGVAGRVGQSSEAAVVNPFDSPLWSPEDFNLGPVYLDGWAVGGRG